MANWEAPGPLIVSVCPLQIESVLLTVMVAGSETLKLIVSPDAAVAIAFRSEPAPLSFVFVTVTVLAKQGSAPTRARTNRQGQRYRRFRRVPLFTAEVNEAIRFDCMNVPQSFRQGW
jgi:hypothetical protein